LSAKAGRRTFLLLGDAACAILLALLAITSFAFDEGADFMKYFVMILIFLYEMFFNLSLGPVVWMYNAEILPVKNINFKNYFELYLLR
jgi:hypothetical protein